MHSPEATPQPLPRRGFAVVDVETSGLDPRRNRVIEIAIALLTPDGEVERRWSTLIRSRGGTGPVHIHGITRAHTHGAPTFREVVPTLVSLLEGRIVVAHNAQFDWGFLAHEAARVGVRLPVKERLCTVTLARQLRIPAPNLKLATLAEHMAVPVTSSHRAEADVTTLVQIFTHCLKEAERQHAPIPMDACVPVRGIKWRSIAAWNRLLMFNRK